MEVLIRIKVLPQQENLFKKEVIEQSFYFLDSPQFFIPTLVYYQFNGLELFVHLEVTFGQHLDPELPE